MVSGWVDRPGGARSAASARLILYMMSQMFGSIGYSWLLTKTADAMGSTGKGMDTSQIQVSGFGCQ